MKQRACTTVHHGFHGACMYLRWVCNKIKRSLGTSNSYILPACFKSSGTCAKTSGLTCKKQDPSDPFTTFVMLCCILLHDVACNREPRLLAVENLDAPAALVTDPPTLCALSAPHKRPVLLRARPLQPT